MLCMNLCLLNAHALYLTQTGKHISLSRYLLEIIDLLARFHTPLIKQRKGKPANGLTPLRHSERNFPSWVSATTKKKYTKLRRSVNETSDSACFEFASSFFCHFHFNRILSVIMSRFMGV